MKKLRVLKMIFMEETPLVVLYQNFQKCLHSFSYQWLVPEKKAEIYLVP